MSLPTLAPLLPYVVIGAHGAGPQVHDLPDLGHDLLGLRLVRLKEVVLELAAGAAVRQTDHGFTWMDGWMREKYEQIAYFLLRQKRNKTDRVRVLRGSRMRHDQGE